MGDLVQLVRWEIHKFSWGVAIKPNRGAWEMVILPDGQEISLTKFNVELHENGIEFLGGKL